MAKNYWHYVNVSSEQRSALKRMAAAEKKSVEELTQEILLPTIKAEVDEFLKKEKAEAEKVAAEKAAAAEKVAAEQDAKANEGKPAPAGPKG